MTSSGAQPQPTSTDTGTETGNQPAEQTGNAGGHSYEAQAMAAFLPILVMLY